MKEFKDILKEARKSKGVSVKTVEKATEIHHTHISKYENGSSRPSKWQLEILANYYQDHKELITVKYKSDLLFDLIKNEELYDQMLKDAAKRVKHYRKQEKTD